MCMCVCLISRNRCFPHAMLRSFYLLLLIFVTMLLMMLIVSLQLTFFQFVCRGAFLVCSNGLYIYIYIYISRWTRRPLPPHPKLLFCTRLCDCASVCLETMCSCPSFNVTSQEHELAAVDLGVLGSTQRCVDASCLTWVSFINISGSVWELGIGPCGAFEMGMEPDHFGAFPPESVHDENLDFNMDTLHKNPSPATAAEATVHALDFMAWLVHLVHM